MFADPNRIMVVIGPAPETFKAHHGDIPELHSDGESPHAAVSNLAQDLERELEGAADALHRQPLEQAIADVKAYIEQEAGVQAAD
jgi:hypothetical protein